MCLKSLKLVGVITEDKMLFTLQMLAKRHLHTVKWFAARNLELMPCVSPDLIRQDGEDTANKKTIADYVTYKDSYKRMS